MSVTIVILDIKKTRKFLVFIFISEISNVFTCSLARGLKADLASLPPKIEFLKFNFKRDTHEVLPFSCPSLYIRYKLTFITICSNTYCINSLVSVFAKIPDSPSTHKSNTRWPCNKFRPFSIVPTYYFTERGLCLLSPFPQ